MAKYCVQRIEVHRQDVLLKADSASQAIRLVAEGAGDEAQALINIFLDGAGARAYNVLDYSNNYLEKHDLFGLHRELDGIKSVGKKIASLYLRDVLVLYENLPEVEKHSDKLTARAT